jgi:hypothetical protein
MKNPAGFPPAGREEVVRGVRNDVNQEPQGR